MRLLLVAWVVAVVAGVAVSLAAGGSGSALAGRWVVWDLGTARGTASKAVDINQRGEIVGSFLTARSTDAMPSWHAFLWSQGKMHDLGTLPLGGGGDRPNESEATAINGRGQVIGESEREQTGPTPHVFFWFKGEMKAVGCGRVAPVRCEVGSTAAALNERGQVVGSIFIERGRYTFGFGGRAAFTWENGTLTRLGALPRRPYSRARDVNERGDVVGASYALSEENGEVSTRAFLWRRGKMTDLGPLPGENRSEAVAINDRGEIIGNSSSGAFLWQNGKLTALGTLPGEQGSAAVAINDRGRVIGNSGSTFANDRGDTIGNSESAFVWQNGRMTGLGVLPGDERSSAVAINDRGQIVGVSYDGGPKTAFVWQKGKMTPLPKLPRGGMCAPTAINDRGEIVGWCGGKDEGYREQQRAVLWKWQPAT